jgi:hypothetical protein
MMIHERGLGSSAGPRVRRALIAVCLLGAPAAGCAGGKGGGELHAKLVLLEREVNGLRASVAKMEAGEPVLPPQAAVVAIGEGIAKEFVDAQLPFLIEVQRFRIEMTRADVSFDGSPAVSLTGSIAHQDHPDYVGEVRAIGALDSIQVDPASGTLRARIAVDHVDLLQMAGLEKVLAGQRMDELARTVRLQLAGKIPDIEIPVKIERAIDLPSVTRGPVRLQGASMPLAVSVAEVLAGQGNLWIAINVVPGEMARPSPSPSPSPSASPARGRPP